VGEGWGGGHFVSSARYLIVTADDYGIGPATSRGILARRVPLNCSKEIHLARASIIIWAGLLLALGILAHLYPHTHTVYDVYEAASRNWWAGKDMYLAAGRDYFRYSPLYAVCFTPFAIFPEAWAAPLWKMFNAALYVVALGFWIRRALPQTLNVAPRSLLLLLAIPLSFRSLYNGQANVIMLAAMLFGLAQAAEGRWNQAAAWLAFATLIKGYPLALALLLMALYPRRFALRFAAALGLGLIIPFLTYRPEVVANQYVSWFHQSPRQHRDHAQRAPFAGSSALALSPPHRAGPLFGVGSR
jgi:Glycosyltransferase family 87